MDKPRWTPTDVAYFKYHVGRKTHIEIAAHLGRSQQAVTAKAWALGLRGLRLGGGVRVPSHVRYAVRALAGSMPGTDIAKLLGVRRHTVERLTKSTTTMGRKWGRVGTNKATWHGDIKVVWTPAEYQRLLEVRAARIEASSYVAHKWFQGRLHA